ncbi:MAG TPA: HAMP domain-containing histidine kinase [Oscillatoriales cyanobacterium M4454_W2019_049]|nr:MAG: sensor histidine kinase [Cyanobacteria bacterium J055]HIK29836.1 HAMP domain-containing histidine kinase [Oscillatoriales cyanobacterium M4454_W2019_049]
MYRDRLFGKTRVQLTLWYTAAMGLILSACGFGAYEAIAHAHRVTLDREIESVAGTLHDSLELVLQKPGHLEPEVRRFLPDLCEVDRPCDDGIPPGHALGAIQQGRYYVRLLDRSHRVVAISGMQPTHLPLTAKSASWQLFTDINGTRYRQISIDLHTNTLQNWGYLHLGRSLQEFDNYIATVRWVLLLGLPVAWLGVGGASWGLAGLAMRPIYRSYNQIQQFTADAAHELRTPLAAIQATIESTLRLPHIGETEAQTTLQTLERQNRRLAKLVKDLLLLSRTERQTAPTQPQPCCLDDLLNDVEEELAALALQAKVNLKVEKRVRQPIEVMGDEAQLYRMVYNLVSNAIDYTPPGGEVAIALEKESPYAAIRVRDTGIGIAEEDRSRIFDRFYRVDAHRSRHQGGSGLGLPISRAIARLHNGKIEVESEVGRGSTFTVYLPLR